MPISIDLPKWLSPLSSLVLGLVIIGLFLTFIKRLVKDRPSLSPTIRPIGLLLLGVLGVNLLNQGLVKFTALPDSMVKNIHKVLALVAAFLILRISLRLLEIIKECLLYTPLAKKVPINPLIILLEVIAHILAAFYTISVLMDKDPLLVLGSVSTLLAFVSFIFKEVLLGLFASMAMTNDGSLQLGDFIEIPQYQTSGTVTNISMVTVEIETVSKLKVYVPAYGILTNSLVNYRKVYSNGIRIMSKTLLVSSDALAHFKADSFISDLTNSLSHLDCVDPTILCRVEILSQEIRGLPLAISCAIKTKDFEDYVQKSNQVLATALDCLRAHHLVQEETNSLKEKEKICQTLC